jgi:adenosylhomocysteine nucleosidase
VTDLGVVTGLAFEARLIEKAFARQRSALPRLACAGPGPERARAAAAKLAAEGAQALVSFGLCGGLDPALRAGDLVLAEAVIVAPGELIETDAPRRTALAARASAAGLRVAGGALIGQDRQIGRAEDKAALYGSSGARAVDMESAGVARAAEAAGVAFLVVRALADPAGRNLPRAALDAAAPDGRLRLFKVLTTMYLRPWESPALVRLAYETRLALDTLERTAEPKGPLFGGD